MPQTLHAQKVIAGHVFIGPESRHHEIRTDAETIAKAALRRRRRACKRQGIPFDPEEPLEAPLPVLPRENPVAGSTASRIGQSGEEPAP